MFNAKGIKAGLLAALTIVMALSLLACGTASNNNTPDTGTASNSAQSAEQSSGTESATEDQANNALSIGDSATVDDITYTLVSVAATEERNQFTDTEPAQVIAITYAVANGSEKDYAYGVDTAVYGPDGKKCDTYPLSTDFGSVSAGHSIDCVVYYGLEALGEIEIEFAPLVTLSDPAVFVVTI